jgi:hypothetical protein
MSERAGEVVSESARTVLDTCPDTISYGGGVQSTALLVLACQERIDFRHAVFANTGDDSEHPDTIAFVRDVAIPYAAEHGVTVHEIRRTRKDGTPFPTLLERITDLDLRSVPIPVRMSKAGVPASRSCTADYKGQALAKWRSERGATAENPTRVAIGFSTDEAHRANKKKGAAWEQIEYPLLDLNLRRTDCEQIIRDAGLDVPPKSACWFCPWRNLAGWREMKRAEPDLFRKAVMVEAILSTKSKLAGSGPVYMTDQGWKHSVPLDEIVGEGTQGALFDGPETCEEGACWT